MTDANFERCADFLARMIEKYGRELDLPKLENRTNVEDDTTNIPQERVS